MRILAVLIATAAVAHADCPPEHAALGHCTIAAAEPACSPEHAAMGHCTLDDEPVVTAPAECSADHAAAGHCTRAAGVGVGVALRALAANYRHPLFEGNYQGSEVEASIAWRRYALLVSVAGYRLERNGLAETGIGDVMLHAHGTLITRGELSAGAMLMASLPTGDGNRGFGMGHVMVMPELWATWTRDRTHVAAYGGYCHALGGAGAHAEHGGGGAWPIVAPMNAREVTGGAAGMLRIVDALRGGAFVEGALPVGDGRNRLIAGGRAQWSSGAVALTAQVAGGVVGDPFGVRALLGVALRVR